LTRWLVRGTYSVYLAYLVFHILPVLGVGRLTQAHMYPALLSNLFTAVTMFLILLRRQTLINREQVAWGEQVKQAQQSLAWERQRGEERASFMSMLLHELKNPLASIRLSALSLLGSGVLRDAPDQRRLDNIVQATQGIDDVLERCRQVDQLDLGNWPVNTSAHDVAALCREWAAAHPLGERLALQAPDTLVAHLDLALLHTMVRNLLDNAHHYSAPDTPVSLVLQAVPDAETQAVASFEVRVSNVVGKAGWPDPQRVFTKYYRAERAYQSTGSGLGLYLVRSLGRMLGGDVTYEPTPERVVFVVRMPCL
jgi:signal transduction histidine kinase